jgi:hypothetical protein
MQRLGPCPATMSPCTRPPKPLTTSPMTRANPFRFVSLLLALALASLGTSISGCGIAGDLTPAPPMWGDARAQHEAEEARKREAAKANPPAPSPTSVTPASR